MCYFANRFSIQYIHLHKNLMIFTKKASILFIFTICIFFTLNLKAQIVNDTIIPIPVDTTSELVLDTTQFEDAYIPEDIQFIPSDILYHNNWNNKDVKIRSEKYFNANNRYTLPLVYLFFLVAAKLFPLLVLEVEEFILVPILNLA